MEDWSRKQFATRELALLGEKSDLEKRLEALSPQVRSYISLGHRAGDDRLSEQDRNSFKDKQLDLYTRRFSPFEKVQLYEYDRWMTEQIMRVNHR